MLAKKATYHTISSSIIIHLRDLNRRRYNMRWLVKHILYMLCTLYEHYIYIPSYLSNKFKKQVKEVEIVLYFRYTTDSILFYIKLAGLQNEKSREVKSDSIRSSNVKYVCVLCSLECCFF